MLTVLIGGTGLEHTAYVDGRQALREIEALDLIMDSLDDA